MKLKSLFLGTVAVAGLTTAGFAADLGVLTSLDVCDNLGLTGLTISSETNCLQISGGVSYEGNWGNFAGSQLIVTTLATTAPGSVKNNDASNGVAPLDLDWNSKVEAWLKFVGTSATDVGPASVVVKFKGVQKTTVVNEIATVAAGEDGTVKIDQGYVQVGSDTVLMIGKKGSIANFASSVYNFTTLFGFDRVDPGTMFDSNDDPSFLGGQVIQVVSTVGEGVKVGVGLEDLADTTAKNAGALVGVVSYAGANLNAHATAFASGLLDGDMNNAGFHIGADGTFDAFKIAGTFGSFLNNSIGINSWHGTLSGQGTFDMFTIALSGEALGQTGKNTDFGFGGSIGAKVTDGVAINLGGKYYQNNNAGPNGYHVAAQLVAAVTETIKLTGEVGVYGNSTPISDFYASANVAWTPDTTAGGFTTSLGAEAHQNGSYKVTVKASKTFQ
ncbi:hypothetical protein [Devosia sp.]|uniref:hypothetical protein n=1 Tax=Devosia sp. TaxID=1871048 RepID=UPI003263B36F